MACRLLHILMTRRGNPLKPILVFAIACACCGAGRADEGAKIVASARKQVGVTLSYDPAYTAMEYPGGDVPRERGVCTDVVIRALRDALGKDLQMLVHEDMKVHFDKYPKIWNLKKTDKNIDHRRVPNLMIYFGRKHLKLPVPTADDPSKFLPGDLVTCTVPPHLPHIMIVSDRKNKDGLPLVIHNIGNGACEEDRLEDFPLTGHFRWKVSPGRTQQGTMRK